MVFSVPVGDGTVIFAKRSDAPDSPIFISDPVCLVNEDAVKKAGEPDKLGAVGSLFKEKATFKLEYDLQGTNSTRTFGFKRRFWKRMNVDLAQFQVHSQNAVRKMEPWLQQLLNQGQISNGSFLVVLLSLWLNLCDNLQIHISFCQANYVPLRRHNQTRRHFAQVTGTSEEF